MGRRTWTLAGKRWQRLNSHSYSHDCNAKQGKNTPEMRAVGCPLLQEVTNQHHSPGAELGQCLSRVLVGHKHSLQWSPAEPTGILCTDKSTPSGFCPGWLLFSHRHQGQVKPDSAVSPPGLLLHFKATRTRVLLCLPIITARVCFVLCSHSCFQCTFGGRKKKAAFYFPRIAAAGKTLSGPSWQDAQRQGTKWDHDPFPLRCLIRCWISDLQILSQGLVWCHLAQVTLWILPFMQHMAPQGQPGASVVTANKQHLFGVYNHQMSNLPLSHWFMMPADSPSQEFLIQTLETVSKNKCYSTGISLYSVFPPQLTSKWSQKEISILISLWQLGKQRWEKGQERFPKFHVAHRTSSPLQPQGRATVLIQCFSDLLFDPWELQVILTPQHFSST